MNQDQCKQPVKKHPLGCPYITEDDIERIAESAATKAVEKITGYVYMEVGKSVIKKILWFAGAAAIGLAAWLHSKGFL
jgi:hypothetical protein